MPNNVYKVAVNMVGCACVVMDIWAESEEKAITEAEEQADTGMFIDNLDSVSAETVQVLSINLKASMPRGVVGRKGKCEKKK